MNSGVTGPYLDCDLVCSDATLSYPKLVAGLVFPSLASCHVLQFPTQHTILLPDFTSTDLLTTVHSLLGKNGALNIKLFWQIKSSDYIRILH